MTRTARISVAVARVVTVSLSNPAQPQSSSPCSLATTDRYTRLSHHKQKQMTSFHSGNGLCYVIHELTNLDNDSDIIPEAIALPRGSFVAASASPRLDLDVCCSNLPRNENFDFDNFFGRPP